MRALLLRRAMLGAALALLCLPGLRAASDTPIEGGDAAAPQFRLPPPSAASLREFQAQRFGLFIHWGPVTLTGGELGWARGSKVPAAEYDQLYRRFNPTQFDPDAWVRLARTSGMRYLVLTAKHMDGFCLWDTKQTDYNIMHSPFRRDIVRELSDACRRGGIRFGAYYCIADWYNPWYPLSGPYYGPKDTILKPTADLERYNRYMMKQLVELETGYGPLECLWFDSLIGTTSEEQGRRLFELVRALQPGILINDRAGVPGDYVTPEARVGRYRADQPWESCMTIGTQWSWKPDDEIKSPQRILHALIGCAGGDGNLLLDVGPTAQGTIEPRITATLAEVGAWLRRYGQSIYGTRGGPYKPTSYVASTRRGNFVYLHITRWRDERMMLPPLPRRVVASTLLTGGTVRVTQTPDALAIDVPATDRQAIDTLVRLELDGPAAGLAAIDLPPEVTVSASATKAPASQYGAAFALDNDTATKWSAPDGQGAATLELTFDRPRAICSLKLEERARPLQIEAYAVSWWDGAQWRHLLTNGHALTDRLMKFSPLTTRKLRIDILKSRDTAAVSEIDLGDVDDSPPLVRDLGVPVKSVSWVRLHPGRAPDTVNSLRVPGEVLIPYDYNGEGPNGRPSLLASMGQNNGGLFVLDIDPATGHCRQFNAPSAASAAPTASFRSPRTGALYVGSASDGHLLRYDPAHPGRRLEDLGAIDPGHATFPTGLDEAADGSIWIGAYPECTLTRFDPKTKRFTQFGSMDPVDHYLSVLCGADGTVAGLATQVHPHVIVLDPATGAHRAVGPLTTAEDPARYIQLFKGSDGLLYLDAYTGKFRVRLAGLEPVAYLPLQMPGVDATYRHAYQEMPTLPGGLLPIWVDGDDGAGTFRQLRLQGTRAAVAPRTLPLDWHGGGSNIFMLHLGPDGQVYGATIGPEHLFRCAPDGGGMIDLGRCSASLGEAYTMGNFSDGTMAIASYVDSRISLYDPRRPCHYGTTAADNPRDVGRLDQVGLRPVAMAVVPEIKIPGGRTVPERVWIGSLPYYGTWGGTLAWLDPRTLASGSHRNLVPDCSPFSLLWLPDRRQLLAGMTVQAGTGAAPKARHGAFVLWDPAADRLLYAGDFGVKDIPDVLALAPAGGGLVYALLGHTSDTARDLGPGAAGPPRLALIDPAARTVISTAPLPAALGRLPDHDCDGCLFPGPDGIYGITAHALYRVKPGTCATEIIWQTPPGDQIDKPGPWIGRTFYFSTAWRLRALSLP